MKQSKGITLIALVITIIVMLILTGVTIVIVMQGGVLYNARKATFQTEITKYDEELKTYIARETMQAMMEETIFDKTSITAVTEEQIKAIIPSFASKYIGKITITNGGITSGASISADEREWLIGVFKETEIINEEPEEPIDYPTLVEEITQLADYKGLYVQYLDETGNTYKDMNGNEILWRIITIDTNINSEQFVKIVSNSIVFNYYHEINTTPTVTALTDTNSANFDVRFTNLKNIQLADKVISILKADIDSYYGVVKTNDSTMTGDLIAIDNTYITGTKYSTSYMWFVTQANLLRRYGAAGTFGVRPVVYLKPNVEVIDGEGTINNPYIIQKAE